MEQTSKLTEGKIFGPLLRFSVPIFFTLLIQALYGGVDLMVVGQFAQTADVSGVASGSMLMQTVTLIIAGLSMGITIMVGEKIGRKQPEEAGRVVGSGICLFAVFAVLLTVIMVGGGGLIAKLLHAPESSFEQTRAYIMICGGGSVFIVAYNVMASIFRGIGDSKTPLITVLIACVINIGGDLLLVAVFHMGAAGAAIATVLSQALSVVISICLIRKRKMSFALSKKLIRFDRKLIQTELKLGIPVALQELLVGLSFLIIQAVVNGFGVIFSAGVGVAERVCLFIMLMPSAYMESMSAFTAQNMGAGKPDRAKRALWYSVGTSLLIGVVMSYFTFFHGDFFSSLFSKEAEVIAASHNYLKAYAIDCMLTPFLFCFIGYYNGCEKTLFVLIQGIVGAFGVRVPIVYLVSRITGATLFEIGLGTPASSLVQTLLCLGMFFYMQKKNSGFSKKSLINKN